MAWVFARGSGPRRAGAEAAALVRMLRARPRRLPVVLVTHHRKDSEQLETRSKPACSDEARQLAAALEAKLIALASGRQPIASSKTTANKGGSAALLGGRNVQDNPQVSERANAARRSDSDAQAHIHVSGHRRRAAHGSGTRMEVLGERADERALDFVLEHARLRALRSAVIRRFRFGGMAAAPAIGLAFALRSMHHESRRAFAEYKQCVADTPWTIPATFALAAGLEACNAACQAAAVAGYYWHDAALLHMPHSIPAGFAAVACLASIYGELVSARRDKMRALARPQYQERA